MNLKLISLWWVLIWADADEDCVAVADKDRVYVTKLISPSLCHQVYVSNFMSTGFRYINFVSFATTPKKECIAEEFATAEARIIDTILHGYNSDIRPSINGTGSPVQVRISNF